MRRILYFNGLQVRDGVTRTPLGQMTKIYRLYSGVPCSQIAEELSIPVRTVEHCETVPKSLQRDHARILTYLNVPPQVIMRTLVAEQTPTKDTGMLLEFLAKRGAVPPERTTQKS